MAVTLNPSTLLSGSGLDVSSIVQQLLSQKSGPLQEWQNEQTTLSTQSGLLQGINNNLTNLSSAINSLADPAGPLVAMAATSSQPSILTATAQSTATSGTHQISVTNLVSSSSSYSDPVSGGVLNAGGLSVQVGSKSARTIAITAGETLSQLASQITSANLGVTANVITDATGSRLSLLSNTSGQPGSLTLTPLGGAATPSYSGTGNGTLSGVAGGAASVGETITLTATDATHFSVSGSVSGALGTATVGTAFTSGQINFTIGQGSTAFQAGDTFTIATNAPPLNLHTTAGGNAALNVDGVPISSASNTVTGVISGVTLNLAGAPTTTPIQLTVGTDTTRVTQAVNNFVSAYNAIIGNINQQYTVDPVTNTEGPLGSDFSLRSLQSSLLNDVTYSMSGNSGYVNLASLGITMNDDGTLSVVTASTATQISMSDALAQNPAAFLNFFQNTSQTGLANKFQTDLSNLTDVKTGVLSADIAATSAQQQALTNSINNLQSQLTAEQQQLTQQYSQVNASLESYPLLLQAVTEVIGSMSVNSTTGQSFTPTLTSGL